MTEDKVKRKRGRPLKTEGKYGVVLKDIQDGRDKKGNLRGRSERGKRNQLYEFDAVKAICAQGYSSAPGFEFLIKEPNNPKTCVIKHTILQELGRLEDPERIRSAARNICEHRLSTERAVRYIRAHRIEEKTGKCSGLTREILKAVVRYKASHSSVDIEMLKDSLGIASLLVSEMFSEIQEEGAEVIPASASPSLKTA